MARRVKHTDWYEKDFKQKMIAFVRETNAEIEQQQARLIRNLNDAWKKISGTGISSQSIKNQQNLSKEIENTKTKINQLSKTQTEYQKLEKRIQTEIAKSTDQYKKQEAVLKNLQKQRREDVKAIQAQSQENKKSIGLFQRLAKAVTTYVVAFFGIQTAIRLVQRLFDTTVKLDQLRFSLRAVITDLSELAGTEAFLTDVSFRYGRELIGMTENYLRFKAALKATNLSFVETQKIFESVSKVTAVLGLSEKRAELAFLALEQMASKGTVSMEELRRQLGDQIPGAVQIMARAMNVSVKELYKMIKANEVLASEALPAFAREMEKTFGTENITNVETLQAEIGKTKNEMLLMIKSLKASGFFEYLLKGFQGVIRYVRRGGLLVWFEDSYKVINRATVAAKDFAETINESNEQQIEANKKLISQYIDQKISLDANSKEYEDLTQKVNELYHENLRLRSSEGSRTEYLKSLDTEIQRVEELIKTIGRENIFNRRRVAYQKQYLETLKDIREFQNTEEQSVDEETRGYIARLREEIKQYRSDLEGLEKDKEKGSLTEIDYKMKALNLNLKIKYAQDDINKALGLQSVFYDKGIGRINQIENELKRIAQLQKLAWSTKDIRDYAEQILALQYLLDDIEGKLTEGEEPLGLEDWMTNLGTWAGQTTDNVQKFRDEIIKIIDEQSNATAQGLSDLEGYSEFVNKWLDEFGLNEEKNYQFRLKMLNAFHDQQIISDKDFWKVRLALWYEKNKELIKSIDDLYNSIGDIAIALNVANQITAEKEYDLHRERLDDLKRSIDEEYRLQQEGKANEYDLLVSQADKEEKLRNESFEKLRIFRKKEAGLQLAQQIGSLTTATAKIFEGTAKDPTTLLIAIGTIAAMLAAFFEYRAQIKAIEAEEPGYAKGTEYVKGEGTKKSDSIKSRLSVGERVVDADTNAKMQGIPNEKLPELVDIWKLNFSRINNDTVRTLNFSELSNKMDVVNNSIKSQTWWFKNKQMNILHQTDDYLLLQVGNQTIQYKRSK